MTYEVSGSFGRFFFRILLAMHTNSLWHMFLVYSHSGQRPHSSYPGILFQYSPVLHPPCRSFHIKSLMLGGEFFLFLGMALIFYIQFSVGDSPVNSSRVCWVSLTLLSCLVAVFLVGRTLVRWINLSVVA